MKASYLNELIAATISGKEFRSLLEAEVVRYAELMKKKGSSIPLVFEEDQDLKINNTLIIKIRAYPDCESLSKRLWRFFCFFIIIFFNLVYLL